MLRKINKALFLDKIPTIVCMLACTASVFMGFAIGYVFFGSGDYYLAYAETPNQYNGPDTVIHSDISIPIIEEPESTPEADEATQEYLYVVSTMDGYLVVHHPGGAVEMTSTQVGALAPEELEQLVVGIRVYTDEALARILQDYGS
ncbi:MAG: hypothetical protein FWE11_03465 [Defluviitaleaceae bacterium]|nr:hypothetical protein [Defluviitaleaceae bacterium]